MICNKIQDLLGLTCFPLNDDGSLAMISTPFTFEDGDGVPVYIEKVPGHVRFFDDGGVMMHFLGRGLSLDNGRKTKFIKTVAQHNGVSFNDDGELEVWAPESQASAAFAKYMAAVLGLVGWEREQQGISTDISLFIEEVAMCLKAWKPHDELIESPEYTGISGHAYRFDFKHGSDIVIAISPHPLSVSAALKKMVDVISAPANQGMSLTVVLDDRSQPDQAKSEGAVLGAVAGVLMMTKLEQLANAHSSVN